MSSKLSITLSPLEKDDREQFIKDNQWSFKYGATEEFGMRDNHFEEEGETISRKTIENSIDSKDSKAYRIILNNQKIGGVVVKIDKENKKGELELLFINPEMHSKGAGYSAWLEIEKMFPEIEVWETFTPYFEKRNIHFYVNKCGFHIIEFCHKFHPLEHFGKDKKDEDELEMFHFQKVIKK